MSKFDEAWKDYFKESSRFADIVNMFCYQGEQVVAPKDVKEAKSGGGREYCSCIWHRSRIDQTKKG